MAVTQLSLLKTKRFLPLFVTQFLGAFNDNIFKNALIVLITFAALNHTHINSALLITIISGLFVLPFFLFSATAGQIADRFEKSRLIIIIKSVEVMIMVFAIIGFLDNSISLLMLVLFLLGTHSTFFGPLKYAILPDHLKTNELIAGNGLIEAGTFIAILLGTIAGGMLIGNHFGNMIICTLLLLAASIGLISSCYIPKARVDNPNLPISANFLKETLKIVSYTKSHDEIFLTILGISWFWLLGSVFLTQMPMFAKVTLHSNEHVFTFFISLFSIGIAIGSLLCNRLLKGKVYATYVPVGALGMTLFTIDLFFASHHLVYGANTPLLGMAALLSSAHGWRIIFDLLLIAVSAGIYTVPLYVILQHKSDPKHRARVIASNNILNALFMVASALLISILLAIGCSVSQMFLITALLNLIVVVYISKLLPGALFRTFFSSLLRFMYRVEVKGLQHYHDAGKRTVIIANHTSFLDALLLAVFLPGSVTFAVNTYVAKKWWIKCFLKFAKTFSLDPTNPMALKSLVDFVKTDKRCVIFPEGRLTVTGILMKVYEGAGLVADKSQATLLPIHIQGAQATPFSRLRGKQPIRWFPQITITIFPPEQPNVPTELKGRARRAYIGLKLYDKMSALLFACSDYHRTLFKSLLDAKKLYGRNYPIIEDMERVPLTYHQLIMRSFILSDFMATATKTGEAVGLLLPNTNAMMVSFFALQSIYRVPAMLNFSSGVANIIAACETAKVNVVYTSKLFIRMAKLSDVVNALTDNNIQVCYLEDLKAKLGLIQKLKALLLSYIPSITYRWINAPKDKCLQSADTAAVILFTSGSEGTPKGVVLSHANVQANRYQVSSCIDFSMHDKIFNAMPVFHAFGLTVGMLLPILSGLKVFFYPSPLHYRIIPELVYDTNATMLFGTDTFLSAYAKCAHPYDFYSVRYVFAGAEKLREETRHTWAEKFGVRIFEGYGATETSPVIAINTPMQHKVNTVGRLVPGIQAKFEAVPGISEGQVLSVQGPNIMLGYLQHANPGVLLPPTDGWYDTGDVVHMDTEGYIQIQGRVKRFAKIAGEMVSLTMVEQVVNRLWPKEQHAIVNIPDPKKGEQLVLLTTSKEASREALIQDAKQHHWPELAIPKQIIVVKQMILLGTGKIDYPGVKAFVLSELS